jgi:hypothetical protein
MFTAGRPGKNTFIVHFYSILDNPDKSLDLIPSILFHCTQFRISTHHLQVIYLKVRVSEEQQN